MSQGSAPPQNTLVARDEEILPSAEAGSRTRGRLDLQVQAGPASDRSPGPTRCPRRRRAPCFTRSGRRWAAGPGGRRSGDEPSRRPWPRRRRLTWCS